MRAGEEKCVADVQTYGLHVLRVFGDHEWPEFAYTVGLFQTFAQPEIIVLGLPERLAHEILNDLAGLMRGGLQVQPGQIVAELLRDYPVTFRPVPPEHVEAHFGWDRWFYDGATFPTLQLIYPDRERRWPWDAGVSENFRIRQPVLESSPIPAWAIRPG